MQVNSTLNLGTIVPLVIFMLAQTVGFVVYVVNDSQSRLVNDAVIAQQLSEMRTWQEKQDTNIEVISNRQRTISEQQSAIIALLEIFTERRPNVP